MAYTDEYLGDAITILQKIDSSEIEKIINKIEAVKQNNGRIFFIGVGGSGSNCSHAVNDFRKIAGIEAYTPVDNVSELTARTNDEGWHTVFSEWLKGSRLQSKDAVFVFSVGGGDKEKNISANIVYALEYAQSVNAMILGIVGRDGGYTARVAHACVVIPSVNPDTVTIHTEAMQGVLWHLIATDPRIIQNTPKWEALGEK